MPPLPLPHTGKGRGPRFPLTRRTGWAEAPNYATQSTAWRNTPAGMAGNSITEEKEVPPPGERTESGGGGGRARGVSLLDSFHRGYAPRWRTRKEGGQPRVPPASKGPCCTKNGKAPRGPVTLTPITVALPRGDPLCAASPRGFCVQVPAARPGPPAGEGPGLPSAPPSPAPASGPPQPLRRHTHQRPTPVICMSQEPAP